jgi:branched-chain amino acid transport system substrate-binding protein
MKRETTQWIGLTLVALGMSGQAMAQAPAVKLSGDTVKIGVLSDMSGLYADLGGAGSIIAVQMAIDDFRAQFKPAYKIEVVSADHLNKPDVGAARVREWYDRDGVDMITDVLQSAVALAVTKVGAEKKRIMMNTGSATTRLTNEDCSPYTVHYVYDTYALANGTARAITRQGGDTWYFLTADYAFGHSLEKDAAEMVKGSGGKVLGSARHPLNASDFSSFLLQAQASKAKIVGLANAGGDAINAIKSASEFGIHRSQTVAALLLTIIDVHALGLPAAQGMVFTEGFYWDLNDQTRQWSRRFFEKAKKMPNMNHAGAYSATVAYLKAVDAAKTDDPDAVMKKLRELPINDMFATNGRIREDGRMVHDMYVVQVKKPGESKGAWDYYHVKAIVPGDEAFQPLSQSRCALVKK